MIVLKDCPNCGSFEVYELGVGVPGSDLSWKECNACGAEWIEGAPRSGEADYAEESREE